MQLDNLLQSILSKFENSRIVLWYDPEKNFLDDIHQLELPEITLLDLSKESLFETKKRIEIDENDSQFLLYFPYEEPDPENDWMLDVKLYCEQFFADHSSMLLNDLGITKMSLRGHIHSRVAFFANKQRMSGLQKWITENEDELSIDRKMIAVIVKADSASITDILFNLLNDHVESLSSSKENSPSPLMKQIHKFGLEVALWGELSNHYSYESAEPSFLDFILKLFCTDLWSQVSGVDVDFLLKNVLKSASGRATAQAFMASWRDSRNFSSSYDEISIILEDRLEISHNFKSAHAIQLVDCETFSGLEQLIIRGLIRDLLDSSRSLNRAQFEGILSKRLLSHWSHVSTPNGKEYSAIFKSIRHAELLMHLRRQYVDGFHYSNSDEMYQAYTDELYQFDQSYRLFNEYVHSVLSRGADILRQLDEEVENLYTNWYLYELGLSWDRCLEQDNLIENWSLTDIAPQHEFYVNEVTALIKKKRVKRVFVIVSDALRYEIAQEITQLINGEKRFKAELRSQLGVLPSYTQLGMAALLPADSLSYQSSTVLADGLSTQGLDNRGAILCKENGMAVSSKDLMNWSNQEGRDNVRGAEVVYIYHDTIDAIGDKLSTEEKIFEACRSAVEELKNLVSRVINRLNASHVLLTADHGFLFQQNKLEDTDKTNLLAKQEGAIEAKKRYILGENLSRKDDCWNGKIADTAKGSDDTMFLLPKGTQRFHFIGGAKFVHGGAMLQEICVPIVHITTLSGDRVLMHEKKPVGVVLASQSLKIVNNIDKIKFIQTEAVDDGTAPRQLNIVIVDSNNKEISSQETINFDSTSPSMDERTREARIKLIGSEFNRNDVYYLVLENIATQTEYNRYVVTIDLAIQDDFF